MQVRIRVGRLVVVDDDVDPLNVDSSPKDVGADEDSLLERLELLVALDSLVLGETRVDADGGEVAVLEELVELGRTRDRLDEDADLNEREGIWGHVRRRFRLQRYTIGIECKPG
jgi:hypothetical protein